MTDREIRKKAAELWKKNFGAISFMAFIYTIFQSVMTISSAAIMETENMNMLMSLASIAFLAPITVGMLNGYWKIIDGNKLTKSHIFEWIGDMPSLWYSIKLEFYFVWKLLPWTFLFVVVLSFLIMSFEGFAVYFVAATTLLLALKALQYTGGMYECSKDIGGSIAQLFKMGIVKMKFIFKRYILLSLSFLPLLLLFGAPVEVYIYMTDKVDGIYYALSMWSIVGMAFVVTPLMSIAGMILYNGESVAKEETADLGCTENDFE